MVKPYLNQVGGKVDNDTNIFTGGLNTYVDKGFLESNQMPYVMNMTMKQPPAIQTRDSRNTLADFLENDTIPWESYPVVSMWAYNQDLIYFITDIGYNMYNLHLLKKTSDNFDYQYTLINTIRLNEPGKLYFCYCRTEINEYVYIANEEFKAKVVLGSTSFSDYTEITDGHYGIPIWHKNRLFLVKPSEGKIEWSNALEPDNFTTGGAGDSGDVFIMGARGKLTGAASFDDKLVIFCEHSMHLMYGHSGVATDTNYFQIVDYRGRVGCLSQDHISVSGDRLYWFGDDEQIYEYTGSYINIISKPSEGSLGGIANLIERLNVTKLLANSNKLYVDTSDGYLFVFDAYNKIWWCEDGGFSMLASYSHSTDNLLMATSEGDILTYDVWGGSTGKDYVYDWETNSPTQKDIEFEFHTRVYGAEGLDMLKTISDVWVQNYSTNGSGQVYINDQWCEFDAWTSEKENVEARYKQIGTFATNGSRGELERYNPQTYEQKRFIVEKMYGQRLNTFQVVVKGKLFSKFFVMKREWRAR